MGLMLALWVKIAVSGIASAQAAKTIYYGSYGCQKRSILDQYNRMMEQKDFAAAQQLMDIHLIMGTCRLFFRPDEEVLSKKRRSFPRCFAFAFAATSAFSGSRRVPCNSLCGVRTMSKRPPVHWKHAQQHMRSRFRLAFRPPFEPCVLK